MTPAGAPPISRLSRFVSVAALVVAGEAIFGLPFHVSRYFRPTFLEVFDLTNTELGLVFATYGWVSVIAYFVGGPIADRFSSKKLILTALVSTGSIGFFFATIPSYQELHVVYGLLGGTTILLFWAAMIRTTRELGGGSDQGKAFGILDGGRGAVAATLALLAHVPLVMAMGDDPDAATHAQRIEAIRGIIYVYTAATFFAAGLAWLLLPEGQPAGQTAKRKFDWGRLFAAFKLPVIWLQALIVVCAYTCYKSIDNYSLFAEQAYGMNEVEAAWFTSLTAWVRLFAALGAGLLADRISASRTTGLCFTLLLVGYALFGITEPNPSATLMLWANVLITCTAIYGLRGVYFALMEEVHIPPAITGTAVGLISFVGFTPDIFAGVISGWILDRTPGAQGHQHLFLVLAGFAGIGLAATLVLRRLGGREGPSVPA